MLSLFVFLSLLSVLSLSEGKGCGPCNPPQCPPLPADGCSAGTVQDSCNCCSICAAAEGELCSSRRAFARRCGPGLECVKSDEDKKNKLGLCVCKSDYEVCGTNGVTYRNSCALKAASRKAETDGKTEITVRKKGRCMSAPIIVTPPAEIYNVSGSQVYLSCEAIGVPTPVLTWKKVISGKKKMELLPGDRDNLAIQTRGGPEKHEVTGWVLISPLSNEEEGSYECHATNSQGEASAVGAIHVVESVDDVIKKVTKEAEL